MTEPQKDEENQKLLYSESYPLNEKKERTKVKAISQVHKLLNGVTLNKEKIYYKPLKPEHIDEVKNLHKEWFPVSYPDEIFEESILRNEGSHITQGAFYFLEEEKKEIILGLIIGRWQYVDKYYYENVGENILGEINDSIDYEEEAQFFLSKNKYYYSVYIVSLGVIDECRKMNIGTQLIKDMMNYVVGFPFCVGIYLHVIVDNYSGKKFYEKNGLKCTKRLKDFYKIEDKMYDSEAYVRIFNKKEKGIVKNYRYSMMNWKEKFYRLLILKPFYFLVKLFLLICLCRCFKNRIKID